MSFKVLSIKKKTLSELISEQNIEMLYYISRMEWHLFPETNTTGGVMTNGMERRLIFFSLFRESVQ